VNPLMERVFRWSIVRIPSMSDKGLQRLMEAAIEVVDSADQELTARYLEAQEMQEAMVEIDPE
jgi:hypothetical protein